MSSLVGITQRGQITIPAPLRERKRLDKGAKVLIEEGPDNSIIVKPVSPFDVNRLYGCVDSLGIGVDKAIEKGKTLWSDNVSKNG